MKPIAVFYHCLFALGTPPVWLAHAEHLVDYQMTAMAESGLLDACSHFVVGINGGAESAEAVARLIPAKAQRVWHGLESRAENLTLVEIEKWVKDHPGWNVLYFHTKGISHHPRSTYGEFAGRWRRCMMRRNVEEWRTAVAALDEGHDAAGCHWMTGQGSDRSQHYFAGTFWWATSDFLAKLPSIYERQRIKDSGIASIESRYEAEVWLGNGPMPKIKDLETGHNLMGCP